MRRDDVPGSSVCDAARVRLGYYVVDSEGLPAVDRAALCRLVLLTLGETTVRFEADVPWTEAADWPADVREAAEVLVTASGHAPADEPYQQTGMMKRGDEALWQALTRFAGYAYDASAGSDNRVLPLVSLADCGTEIVVRLDEEERDLLQSAVTPVRLMSHRAARAERRHRR